MTAQTVTVLEGTWEEILEHAPDLAGKRLLVTVLPGTAPGSDAEGTKAQDNQTIRDLLEQIRTTPLTDEEESAFDDWERNQDAYRLRFRSPEAFE